jgi:hypothetical protein
MPDREEERIAAALQGASLTVATSETPASFQLKVAATLPDLRLLLRQLQMAAGGRRSAGAVPAKFQKF